MEKGQKLEN